MNTYNNFQIRKQTSITGEVIYKVFARDNFMCPWVEFVKDNDTLEDAIDQVKSIASNKLEKSEVVLETSIKAMKKNQSKIKMA